MGNFLSETDKWIDLVVAFLAEDFKMRCYQWLSNKFIFKARYHFYVKKSGG